MPLCPDEPALCFSIEVYLKTMQMQYNKDQRVHVQFRVDKTLLEFRGNPSDYYVAVSGTGLQLGNKKPEIAPRCQLDRQNVWVKDIWPHKNSHVDFRFLVVHRFSNTIEAIEDIDERRLFVGDRPVIVQASFDKPGFTVTDEIKFTCILKINNLHRRETKYNRARITEKPKKVSKSFSAVLPATDNTKGEQNNMKNKLDSQSIQENLKNSQLKLEKSEYNIEAKKESLAMPKIKEEPRIPRSNKEKSQVLESSGNLLVMERSRKSTRLVGSGKDSKGMNSAKESIKLRKKQEEGIRKLLLQRKCEDRQVKRPVEKCSMTVTQEKEYEKDEHKRKKQIGQECDKFIATLPKDTTDVKLKLKKDEHKGGEQMKLEYDNTKDALTKEIANIKQKLDEEVCKNDNNVKSTPGTSYLHGKKKYLLMAAGAAVVVGCIAFFKK